MATIAAAAIVAGGAAYAANSAGKSADAQNGMIEEQIEEARRIRKQNTQLANEAYADIEGLISGLPGIESFIDKGGEIAREQRDDRLNFILGDSLADIRRSQGINAGLAAYDFAGLSSEIGKIVQQNLFDVSSLTRDSVSGTFANLSVSNMANLAQQGLAASINTGDFIGRISGVDQFNPYNMAVDLFNVEQSKMANRIQNTTNRVNAITETNNQWFSNYADLSNARMAVEANKTAAQISAVNSATSAIGGMVAGMPAANAQNAQADFYKSSIGKQTAQADYYKALTARYTGGN